MENPFDSSNKIFITPTLEIPNHSNACIKMSFYFNKL